MSSAVDLEVLVVSYNSADTLSACLASVQSAAPGTSVAIREHGDDPAALERLARIADRHPSPVRIEHDPSNPGFGAGCNALARGSGARWLLFLNPDAEIVDWPWNAETPPPAGTVVGPRLVDSGHPGAHSGVDYRVRDEIMRSWMRRRGPLPRGRGFVSGAALLVDRESFHRVGGFDEGYFLFYEDIDLCLRANDIGVPTAVESHWTVRHSGAHSTRSRFGASIVWSYESAVRFHTRHGHPVPAYRCYVVADSVLRAGLRLLRRDHVGGRAYLTLARRAASDLLSDRSRRSPP